MPSAPQVVALLVSDIHLSPKPPLARSAEPDWYAAMGRQLKELDSLACKHRAPIICAGDVFDRWNSPPELINFAIHMLPEMYAIPGQHDLPLHRYEDIEKSAYWTLVEEGTLINLNPTDPVMPMWSDVPSGVVVHAFPWNHPVTSRTGRKIEGIQLAVCHSFIWMNHVPETGYVGAPEDRDYRIYRKALEGYDVALFGDNHKGFLITPDPDLPRQGPVIHNHGTFFRRKSDERNYQPRVGLLMSDGTVRLHDLDVSEDKFIDVDETKFQEEASFTMDAFLQELNSLTDHELNFREALEHYLSTREVSPGARQIILESLELP